MSLMHLMLERENPEKLDRSLICIRSDLQDKSGIKMPVAVASCVVIVSKLVFLAVFLRISKPLAENAKHTCRTL